MNAQDTPPLERHDRVPGMPAFYVQRSFMWVVMGSGLGLLLNLVSVLFPAQSFSIPIRFIGICVICGCMAMLGISMLIFQVQRASEVRSGYTTLRSGFPDLDMVDPRTGIVLRKAGEPELDPEMLRARVEEASKHR